MKTRKNFMKTAGGGGFPRLARVMTCLMLMLTGLGTGAWATDVYLVGNGTGNWLNGVAWDPGVADNKMTEQNGVYSITFNDVDANSELQFKFAINGTWAVNYGCTSTDANELNKTLSNIDATGGTNFLFGLTEKADVTISFNLSEMTYMISTKGMKVGDDAAAGYTVSLKDGTADADKWTVKVGDGTAQALPIEGLSEGQTVTLTYTGSRRVKSVTATWTPAEGGSEEPAAKEPATVTTAPTGAAGLTTASAVTEKLVTGGVADGGTLKYAITNTTTQPDDAAFTLTISPTVSDLKTALSMSTLAAGTYYVWYKVFADADHADSEAAYVSVAVALPPLSITSPSVGQVIGSDGKNYVAANVPTGVDKVAMIAYVSGSNGLAIALADEASTMNWATAKSTCEAKTPAFTGGTWKLPTQDEWKQMFKANGNNEESYSGLNTAITNAGGTALPENNLYWSSSEYNSDRAYLLGFDEDEGKANWLNNRKANRLDVRACLAF